MILIIVIMKKIILPLIIVIIIVLAGVAVWWFTADNATDKPKGDWSAPTDESYEPGIEADQRFGFLIGPSAEEIKLARETGAGWARPHPARTAYRRCMATTS